MDKTRPNIKDPTGYQHILLRAMIWNIFPSTFLCAIKNLFPHLLPKKMEKRC